MEVLFRGITLKDISTSMTINAPAAMALALYIVVAEQQGATPAELRGTIQADILKEYIAQKEWIYPPRPSMRIVTDMIEYCSREMPLWHPVSVSGYHIREAGSTAIQELAFTLADGFAYVEACIERGMDVDHFAPRLSFFFNSHLDFFEEIAKYPCGAPHLCEADEGTVRSEGPAIDDAAVPHADRRMHAHGAAAGEQHRPHGVPGAGRRAGRDAVAAHELDGRDAGAAGGEGREDRSAHAADHRA